MSVIKLTNLIPSTILMVSILSILPYTTIPINFPFAIVILIEIFIITLFFIIPRYSINKQKLHFVRLLLIWYCFSMFRGMFIAETYWDWKGLFVNALALLLPIIAFTSINVSITRNILLFYLKYTLPLILIIGPFISIGAIGFFLTPISITIIFLPLFTRKLKILVILLSIFVLLSDLGARSNVIKFAIPFLLLSFYYFRILHSVSLLEIMRKTLVILPIILFTFGVMGIFNVFKMDDYIKKDISTKRAVVKKGQTKTENLKADTRTFLYVEVLQSAKKYNTWWIGRSPARGNETKYFGEYMKKTFGRAERLGNEVAILNIFTWTGIVGVVLYFLVFYQASYLAVNRSNNIISKILGIYIAFRWLYAWIEDANYFTSTTFTLWLVIGLCYSKPFRNMNNSEIKHWVRYGAGSFNFHLQI